MSARALSWPFPGLVWGDYPQQLQTRPDGFRRSGEGVLACRAFASEVASAPLLQAEALPARLAALLAAGGGKRDGTGWLREAFVLARCAMRHTLGFTPHPQQLAAARLLIENRLVELPTGGGKTVAIALAAAVAALGRTPVHVVTANDYLARRDALALQGFYRRLGLGVGHIAQEMDSAQRRRAYGLDVAYCTAKELAFDYLRDSAARAVDLSPVEQRARQLGAPTGAEPAVLRGLCMAILDEADTVLIDEARVPLVLSRSGGGDSERQFHRDALALAAQLREGVEFSRTAQGRSFELMPAGRDRVRQWPAVPHPLLGHRAHRESVVALALTALHGLQRDRDYVVRDGKVALVDETTGRAAPGRAWSRGLHQLVEGKEGLEPTQRNATMSQISFQRFFPRYLRLAGMSGTLDGAAAELRAVYGLEVAVLAAPATSRITRAPSQVFADSRALWQAVADRAAQLSACGRPVLIGTESVAQSEALSALLASRALGHQMLNACQHSAESSVISAAGRAGAITVATSMAGRGTDVLLEPDVVARGGLHVILCQHNASRRIDRQFLGRAGRNGQAGSVQTLLALDFPLMQRWLPRWWRQLLRRAGCPAWLALPSARLAQWLESRIQKQQRVALCRQAQAQERDLTFSRRIFP